jgi:hypothetical protein
MVRAYVWVGLLLPACRGDDPRPRPDGAWVDVEPVSVVVGPDGGEVALTDGGGTTLTLTVPPDALVEDTTIGIASLEPGPDLARFAVSPVGLQPRVPLQATVEGAEVPADGSFVWVDGDGRAALGGEVSGRSITAPLAQLGFRPSADPLARTLDEGGAALAVAPVSCAQMVQTLEAEIGRLQQRGDPDAIAREGLGLRAAALRCAPDDLARLEQATCDRYRATEASVAAIPLAELDTEAAFERVAGVLIRAESAVQILDLAECSDDRFDATVDRVFAGWLAGLEARYAATPFHQDVEAHLDELEELLRYEVTCQLAGSASKACAALRARLFPDVLDRLRSAAWTDCRTTDNPAAVERVLAGVPGENTLQALTDKFMDLARYTVGAIEGDATHCASRLEVSVFDALPAEVEAERRTLAADVTPSAPLPASVVAPPDGSVTLAGHVLAPPCPGPSPEDDVLVARVGEQEVGRSTRSGGLYNVDQRPIDLAVPALLRAAGLPLTGGELDVVVSRDGGSCPLWHWPFPLYTVHVTAGQPLADATLLGTGSPYLGTELVESVCTSVSCEEDNGYYDVTRVPLAADAPLPTTLTGGATTLSFDAGLDRIAVRVTTTLPGPITDTCLDGSTYTERSSTGGWVVQRIVPRVPVTLSFGFGSGEVLSSVVYTFDDESEYQAATGFGRLDYGAEGPQAPVHLVPPQQVVVAAYVTVYADRPLSVSEDEVFHLDLAPAAGP